METVEGMTTMLKVMGIVLIGAWTLYLIFSKDKPL